MNNVAPLSLDDQIANAHYSAMSYYHNPRNLEYPHRWAASLRIRQIGELVSPGNLYSVRSEYSLWPWVADDHDEAPDMVAALNDGELNNGEPDRREPDHEGSNDDEPIDEEPNNEEPINDEGVEADVSFISTTSTLCLGSVIYRACDFALFYSHLSGVLPATTTIETVWSEIPLALVELKRNTSRKFQGVAREAQVVAMLRGAKKQLGEQGLCSGMTDSEISLLSLESQWLPKYGRMPYSNKTLDPKTSM